MIWSFVTRHPVHRKRLRLVFLLLLLLFSNNFLANQCLLAYEYEPPSEINQIQTAIVLTGITKAGMVPDNQFHLNAGAERILEAVRLYHDGKVSQILISGGAADLNFPEYNEGHSLARLAIDLQVKETDIILENRSRNTHENAMYTSELITDKDEEFLLITSSFHMRRAKACFEKERIRIITYPVDYQVSEQVSLSDFVPSDEAFRKWNILTKELVGLTVYKLMGYI